RPHPRRRPGQLGAAAALLVLALLGSACSTGGDDAAPTTTEPERSSGGPTTTTTPGTGAPGTPGSPSDPDDPDAPSPVQDGIRIEVVSSQPDRVTGPDARVRLLPARGAGTDDLTLRLGDRDVTDQLTAVDGRLEGVVTGLVEGNNALVASAGGESVTQRIRSWPLSGPMISGPHAPLLACSTEAQGLGPPSDEDCSAATRVTWRYVTTGGAVQPLPDPSARPADLATAEIEGDEVALVIRHEQGVVNRSTYEIASIDPSPGGADNSQADAAWNGRLLYRYGDGCGTTYGQGDAAVEVLDPAYLRQGFAVATASFNTGAVQCNDVVSAETTMMVKERFIEEFGDPEATIGEGTGFGAAQLHLIVQDYPGLLDGGVALDPLPDVVTVANGIADCVLLNRYYRSPAGAGISPDQRAAINGHAVPATCDRWEAGYGTLFDPERGCDPAIAPEAIYAAGANPGGVRCTLQDGSANQLGRDAATGYAGRPLDNVGVQYGLEALNAGTIDLEAFLALNEDLGGLDADGAAGPDRHEADVAAVQAAYETGRVSTGVGDQRKVPIVDVSLYDDPTGAVADHVRAFSLRDRFTYGGPAESVPGFRIWTRDPAVTPAAEAGPEAVAVVDRWLAAVADDTEGGERELVLFRARPEAAVDNCLPAGATDPVVGAEVYDEEGPCRDDFPVHGSTRIAAGAPRADDVLKCELKPVDPDDYEVELTEAQYDQLVRVFPSGVCDWAQAGVGQTTPSMSDRTYEDVITPGELA
ncbi:MAG TPA: DUF6351 family protein, partial [Aquihabitans sp.]|nr:DUF6351 family protein [Aquihabitans sp.]